MKIKCVYLLQCSCNGEVHQIRSVRDEDDTLFIVGKCEACDSVVKFELDSIVSNLYEVTLAPHKGNGSVN